MYLYVLTIVLLIVLIYSSIVDIKKREIPIEWFLAVIIPIGIVAQVLHIGPPLNETIIITVIVAVIYFILALFFKGGGGDVIMMVALSVCLGKRMILIIGIATILLAVWRIFFWIAHKNNTEIPYAPVVLIGFLIERVALFI